MLPQIPWSLIEQGPAAVALELANAAELNADQKKPVALVARALQKAWLAQAERGSSAGGASEHTASHGASEHVSGEGERGTAAAGDTDHAASGAPRHTPRLPLCGKLLRLLLVGGGGCGKTRIIVKLSLIHI